MINFSGKGGEKPLVSIDSHNIGKLKCYQAKNIAEICVELFEEKMADVVLLHEVSGPFRFNYLYFTEQEKLKTIKSLLHWDEYRTKLPNLYCFLVPGEISDPVRDLNSINIQTEIL